MVTWVSDISAAGQLVLVETARKSVSLHPDGAEAWRALGKLLIETGQFEEAEERLNEAASRLPAEPRIHLLLAEVRRRVGELDAAMAAVETALSLVPSDRAAALKRFDIFVDMRRWERVALDLSEVTTSAPARQSVIRAHAHFARCGDDPKVLLGVCEAALVQLPGHTFALHNKAIALSMLGRDAEACAVIGLNDFVSVTDLPVREQRIDGETFLDALAVEILRNPTLVPDPHGKATREGLQTRVLQQPGARAVPLLLDQVKSAVERYVEALPRLSHPFATARAARVGLRAWAVVYPKDGRQKSHMHPAGWISGVTYVSAPRIDGESNYRGPLVLGELDPEHYPESPPWGIREVEPIPGQIVLFPSFVPHATRPTGLPEQRISVAFDVVPA